jgi:uncharacterized repeat protein (TIGR03803 family)
MGPAGTGGYYILHDFQGGSSDGAAVNAGLIIDISGNLYGTTAGGGASGYGTVFEVSPPTAPYVGWTETVLHAFSGGDGGNPQAALTHDGKGHFYGTTFTGGPMASSAGTVFGLWTAPIPGVCSNCRSPVLCCACAGGIWNGKQCS